MFNLFSKKKYKTGIDITPTSIHFLEISKKGRFDEVVSYGEITDDENLFTGERLLKPLSEIRKVVKGEKIFVTLPEGKFTDKNFDILTKAGFKHFKLIKEGTSIKNALVPSGSNYSFLSIHVDDESATFVLSHKRKLEVLKSKNDAHHVSSTLSQIYSEWYEKEKEKITHILFTGKKLASHDFLDEIRRHSHLSPAKGNVFINLNLDPRGLPMITKEESLAYTKAIGALID